MTTAIIRPFVCLAAVLTAASLPGCYSYSTARRPLPRQVGSPGPSPEWPKEDVSKLEALQAATPPEIFHARLLPGATLESLKHQDTRDLVTKPSITVKRNEIVEGTLVRWYEKRDELLAGLEMMFTGFLPNGNVLTARDLARVDWQLMQMRGATTLAQINKMWADSGIERDPTDTKVGIDEGIPFRLPPPDQLPSNCRGIALHLWALGGNEYEQAVADQVRARGWLVVDIKPRSGAPSEPQGDVAARIIALEEERDSLSGQLPHAQKGESSGHYQDRMNESAAYRRQLEIYKEISNLRYPPVELCSESDVPAAADALARRIDAALVQNAQAVRAVLEMTRRVHPTLRKAPVAVMGFSAGALSTPTVAAFLGQDVSEVVIVGGAANLLAVSQRSEKAKGGVKLTCGGKPPPAALVDKLEAEYLSRCKFDGYYAAPLLAAQPVLVVDAGMDTWVPSDLGELLYERLGGPDRLHMALGGHEMLFYFLTRRAGWIADWIDTHSGAPQTSAVAGSAPGAGSGAGFAGSGSK